MDFDLSSKKQVLAIWRHAGRRHPSIQYDVYSLEKLNVAEPTAEKDVYTHAELKEHSERWLTTPEKEQA